MLASEQPNILRANPEQLAAWWQAVVRPGDAIEVRIPKPRRGGPRRWFRPVAGYFDDGDAFVRTLAPLTGLDAEGVYATINPVNPDLLARAANRLQEGLSTLTQDADVVRRRHLLVDVDPVRASGISANEAERAAALARRDQVAEALADLGWPPPVAVLATGNGGGLLYRVRLDNTPEALNLVSGVLRGLAGAFGDGAVTIDTGVANAARIAKVAGTVAAKGDDIHARPWRLATAEVVPGALPVPDGLLRLVAAWAPAGSPAPDADAGGGVRDRLRDAGVGFIEAVKGYGTVFKLDRCLTSGDHTDGACVIEFASGALAYKCHHNRCADKGWVEVREQLGYGRPVPVPTIGGRAPGEGLGPRSAEPRRPEAASDLKRDKQIALTYDAPPAGAFLGPFGEYVELMRPTTESPDAFLLASLLTTMGAVMGRRVQVRYPRNLYPNLYTALVGITGRSRKDHAADLAVEVTNLQACPPTEMIAPPFAVLYDVSSAEGLVKWLKTSPNTLLRLTELTHLLDNAARKSTSTILDKLIELWGTPAWTENQNKLSPVRADKPYLSILAATQPSRLETKMTDIEVHSGFANRWLYVFGRGKEPMPEPPAYDPRDAWALYVRLHKAIQAHPEGAVLDLTPRAKDLWNDWYVATMRSMDDDEAEAAIRIRHHPIARKLALVYAVGDGEYDVDRPHLEAAIGLLDWSWKHLKRAVTGWGSSDEVKLELRIADVLRTRGPLPRWKVQQQCRRPIWTQALFKRAIESMVANGAVVRDGEGQLWLREQVETAGGNASGAEAT